MRQMWRAADPRRRRTIAGAGVLAGVVLLGVGVGMTLTRARDDLTGAREAALHGRDALVSQNVAEAAQAFTTAAAEFERGRSRLASPVVRILDVVPVGRQNIVAARASAEAGRLVSHAGLEVAESLDDEQGGPAALAPRDGRIPLEPLQDAAEPVARAARRIRRASALVDQTTGPWLVGSVAGAVQELDEQLTSAGRLADAAEALTRQLPVFLGAEGPRRYFFGAGNPAELRGAGGFVGAYAILTVDDGRLSFGEFAPIHDLETVPPSDVQPPNPDYADRYDRYGGAGFWLNINMTPDFPSAASAMESLYERVAGERLDGTIVADPGALATLLAVAGPAEVPGVGQVTAEEIVPLMANEAFGEFDDHAERKRALGAVAAGVFNRFLHSGAENDPVTAGRALAEAAAAGHLLIHAAEPAEQEAFETAGVAGQLPAAAGDFLAVVGNNAAGNKVDFYTDRTVSYRAALAPDGAVRGEATVTLKNGAPTTGQPGHVIGPNTPELAAGDNRTILGVYCAPGCALDGFEQDGEPEAIASEKELGHPVYSTSVMLPSGETTELSYEWTTPDTWSLDENGGVYQLTVREQTTIRPTRFELGLSLPDGLQPVSTSHDMERDGQQLTWTGELRGTEIFEVELQRALPTLLAQQFRTWVNRPLLLNVD